MAINTNAQNVIIGDSLVDYCTYQESASRYAIPGKNHMGQPMMIPIGEHILSRHMLLLGGIGTGKSNAFNHIIRNTRSNLTNEDVMIIFDTKGDFYKEFYRPGDVVISNDARATGGSEADYWNIFEEVTIDDRVEENILEIAKGLFAEKLEHTTQPFFPNAAKDLFAALMLHLVRNDKFADKRNNKSLRSYLNSITPHIMVDILNQHSDLKAMQSYIYDEKSGQTLGVMAELQQMMREIFIGNFQKKGGLSMRKLVRRKGGRVIFVEYDLGIGGMLMPIYRLLIDLAIKEALCRTSNEGNVYFFIDEFRLVPHLEHIDDGVNFGRSLGAKFFVGIQNIDQVMAAYGEYTGRSILSGFGTTFAFRVNDVGSREYIKNLFGRNIKQQSYMSKVQNRGIQLKEVLEQRGYQVVLTRESNNVPISCVQRAEVANNLNADVYVRIHANGSENSNAKGAMTICTTPNNPYNASIYGESKALSEAILDKYCEVTGCNKEYVWETDTMSGNNWSQVPVTIVEMGYMSNPEEDVLMQTAEYQQKMVQGIADGIDAYMENY